MDEPFCFKLNISFRVSIKISETQLFCSKISLKFSPVSKDDEKEIKAGKRFKIKQQLN